MTVGDWIELFSRFVLGACAGAGIGLGLVAIHRLKLVQGENDILKRRLDLMEYRVAAQGQKLREREETH